MPSSRRSRRPHGRARRAAWIALYAALAASPLAFLAFGAPPRARGFMADAAAGIGYIALAMLALQLALGARPRGVVNDVGLDAVLLFHRASGLWATAFVMTHVALLALRAPRFVIHLLEVRASPPHGLALWLVILGLALLVLVPRQLTRLRIPYEAWRVGHGLVAAFVVAMALWHMRALGRSTTTQAATTALVVAAALALVAARFVRPTWALRRPWRVADVRAEGARVWTLVLEAEGHGGLVFEPGQSVWLTLDRSPFSPRQHPFTIASSAASPARIELTIKELGDFTRDIGRTPLGARAFLTGPYGVPLLDGEGRAPMVAITGGIGITPMMSVLRTLRDRRDRRPVLLIHALRAPEDAAFLGELDDLARTLDLRLVPVFERPPPGWSGERGVVGPELLARHLPSELFDAEIVVCGPEPMMNIVERALRDRGVPWSRVHAEHFVLVGSRPPGGRSIRERHIRALVACLAVLLLGASAAVAVARNPRIGTLYPSAPVSPSRR